MSRELDARVAEVVMGAKWIHEPAFPGGPANLLQFPGSRGILVERRCRDGRTIYPCNLSAYSTDIAAAMSVVRKATDPSENWALTMLADDDWCCEIYGVFSGNTRRITEFADTAPEAICRAALAAVAATPDSQPNPAAPRTEREP